MINDATSDDNDDVSGDIAMTIQIMIIDHAGGHGDWCDEDAHDDGLMKAMMKMIWIRKAPHCDDDTYDDDLDPKCSPLLERLGEQRQNHNCDHDDDCNEDNHYDDVMMTPMMMILIRKALHCSPWKVGRAAADSSISFESIFVIKFIIVIACVIIILLNDIIVTARVIIFQIM